MKWFQYAQSMGLCEQLLWAFDFPLKQQSRICALQRQTPSLLLLLLLPPCLTDVTGVDFIHVHKGSPTLGSPRRWILLVCAMATTTNKGQSPMVMANWVCSHYWLSKQWSTDGGLASPTQLTLLPLGGLDPAAPQLVLSCTSLHHARLLHKEIRGSSVRGALPVRDNRLTVSANCLINDSPVLGCSSTSLWGANCSDWFASVNYWWGSELKC